MSARPSALSLRPVKKTALGQPHDAARTQSLNVGSWTLNVERFGLQSLELGPWSFLGGVGAWDLEFPSLRHFAFLIFNF
jgi:hypothetical protein